MTVRAHRSTPSAVVGVLAALALAVILTACGTSNATPAPSAIASLPPASSASSDAPVSPPADTPEPSVDRHGVPALEALLPKTVAGVDLERLSLTGADFYALGTDDTRRQLDVMLKNLGKTTTDLSVGDAGDPTGKAVLEVGAFRVAGSPSAQLLTEWVASRQAASPGRTTVSNVTIDGRALTKIVDAGHPVGGTIYAFVKVDTIFLVAADDPAILSDALGQLPRP